MSDSGAPGAKRHLCIKGSAVTLNSKVRSFGCRLEPLVVKEDYHMILVITITATIYKTPLIAVRIVNGGSDSLALNFLYR